MQQRANQLRPSVGANIGPNLTPRPQVPPSAQEVLDLMAREEKHRYMDRVVQHSHLIDKEEQTDELYRMLIEIEKDQIKSHVRHTK